jgi:hypothetical protein
VVFACLDDSARQDGENLASRVDMAQSVHKTADVQPERSELR